MKYRLIASDMDGTLLNSAGDITPYTERIINAVRGKGVVFALSTGRPLQGVRRYIQQLGLDCPVITYNGAVIAHSRTGQIIFRQNMDTEEARRVWHLAQQRRVTTCVWSENKLYANEISDKTAFYEEIVSTKATLIENIEDIISNGITKILCYDDSDALDKWIDELSKENLKKTTFVKSRAYFLEFFSSKVSKAVAMEKLGEYYRIDRSEMIAIGDQANDLSMIEYAGLGVAVENAVDKVKKAAGYIAASNNEDGVAQVLQKFILSDI